MWPGMRPATGWIAYFTWTPRCSRMRRELAHGVLGLRRRHAVARDEDDLPRVGELRRDVLQRDLAHHAFLARLGRGGRAAERAEQDVRDRAVHRLAHEDREDEARAAVQRARDDEDVVPEREARGGGREARVRVQERDDDGHVRGADRQDEQHAEEEREGAHRVEEDGVARIEDERDEDDDRAAEEEEVEDVLSLVRDRLALHELLELREGDEAARERDAAEQDLEAERRDLERAEVLAVPEELRDADEGRGEAAERVGERRPLRHRGHRHPEAHRDADRRARRGGRR